MDSILPTQPWTRDNSVEIIATNQKEPTNAGGDALAECADNATSKAPNVQAEDEAEEDDDIEK